MPIIIGLSGGMGNQFFQFALGKSLQKKGLKVIYDTSFFDGFRSYKLNHFIENIELIDIYNFDLKTSVYLKFRRTKGLSKILRFIYSTLFNYLIVENKKNHIDQRIFDITKNCFLEGHWARHHYFDDIKSSLQEEISLKKEYYSNSFKEYQELIRRHNPNSVSIHIRRTDYLKPIHSVTYCNLTETNYYTNAIKYLKSKVDNPIFFIFSDDIEWCKENLIIENACYILPKKDMKDYHDFELIKQCNHHINANSTFSWWAAYLNPNPDKIVTIPKIWFNSEKSQKKYEKGYLTPKEWIKI